MVTNDVYQSEHSNMPNDGERIVVLFRSVYRVHLIDKENVHFKRNEFCGWVEGKLNYQTCTIDSNKTAATMMLEIKSRRLDPVENENDKDQHNQWKQSNRYNHL